MRRFHYATLGSTNVEARRLAAEHPGEALLVTADVQTDGRGRTGRAWSSPEGGAWLSVVCPTRPGEDPEAYRALPLLAGLAVVRELEALLGEAGLDADDRALRLGLKWPNDVLLGGRKVAGVLCERSISAGGGPARGSPLVVGVGVNLNCTRAQLGAGMRFPATIVREATGRTFDVHAFACGCGSRVGEAAAGLARRGLTAEALDEIESRLAFKGEAITLSSGPYLVEGHLVGLGPRGELRLEAGGEVRCFDAGEVCSLSPANPPRKIPLHP